jgi:hypothetical protein
MPGSITVAAFVFGAVLILVAILGGGFKAFGAEISERVGTPLRVVAGVIGALVLLATLYPTLEEANLFGSKPKSTSSSVSNEPPTGESALKVNYSADEQAASMDVGNGGTSGVIIVRQLTLHWEYKPCPRLTPATGSSAPGVVNVYTYEVRLSTSDGSDVLDPRPFKYGPGEVDGFFVYLQYPGNGIYTLWLSFRYRALGDDKDRVYTTRKEVLEVCAKFSR